MSPSRYGLDPGDPIGDSRRRLIIDPLTEQQLSQLGRVSEAILTELNATSERPLRQDRTRTKRCSFGSDEVAQLS